MKPLVRWTIGPANEIGYTVLENSVTHFKNLYGDRFDYIICYNQISPKRFTFLNTAFHEQSPDHLPINPLSVSWKLYPPRLRINAHEICIDSDILLLKPLEEIEYFLKEDSTLLYEGLKRNFTLGQYKKHLGADVSINSGIYGMPPGFDFKQKILHALEIENQTEWTKCYNRETTFDEQGLVASILYNYKKVLLYLNVKFQYVNLEYQEIHMDCTFLVLIGKTTTLYGMSI